MFLNGVSQVLYTAHRESASWVSTKKSSPWNTTLLNWGDLKTVPKTLWPGCYTACCLATDGQNYLQRAKERKWFLFSTPPQKKKLQYNVEMSAYVCVCNGTLLPPQTCKGALIEWIGCRLVCKRCLRWFRWEEQCPLSGQSSQRAGKVSAPGETKRLDMKRWPFNQPPGTALSKHRTMTWDSHAEQAI